MKYESYQRLGLKTFFVLFLEGCLPAIVVSFIWVVLVFIKTAGVESVFSFLNSPSLIPQISKTLDWALVLGVLVVLFFWVLVIVIAVIRYWSFYFMLDDHSINVRQGILYKTESSVPFKHIENIDVHQSLVYQLIGVCKFEILTAGQERDDDSESEIEFPVIDKSLADDIKKELFTRSNLQFVERSSAPTI